MSAFLRLLTWGFIVERSRPRVTLLSRDTSLPSKSYPMNPDTNVFANFHLLSDKMKGYGKLKIRGTLDGVDLEIYGDLTIDGYL